MSRHDFVQGEEAVFAAGEFTFESGGRLADLQLGYVTHGRLNTARDNAILLAPGTANTRHSADGYIGEGNALDPKRHFIIAVDAIGAGTSSKPEDGLGGAFPRYSIRDMVRAEHALVASFGVRRLKAVMGASMGAFQALEWAIQFPDAAARAILLVPAARAGNVFRSVVRAMIEVIELDPGWNGGRYEAQPLGGLRAAGRIYYPWTVSDVYLESLAPHALEAELAVTVERAVAWDAWNLIRRYQASAGHDVAAPFGGDLAEALSRVKAALLVLPASSDRLLGVETAREIAARVRKARYAEVPTVRGHLGWRAVQGAPETRFIADHIARFLDNPEMDQ
jgi:homoserine O-acetyltransferase/O-succinyltransferase